MESLNQKKILALANTWYIKIDQTILKNLWINWDPISKKLNEFSQLKLENTIGFANALSGIKNMVLAKDIPKAINLASYNLQTANNFDGIYLVIKHEI